MNNIKIEDWLPCFPKGLPPRQVQKTAINFILKTFFQENKKYCVLEAPTGTGKSFIAAAVSNYINSINPYNKSYILTTQIILQAQYKQQFQNYGNVSSRNNYSCAVFNDSSCADMKWLHDFKTINKCDACPYQKARKQFIQNSVSITNTAFFMSNLQYNQELIRDRMLMVVDQAHNLQEQMIKHKGMEISFFTLNKDYGFAKQDWVSDKQQVFQWIFDKLYMWLQNKKQYLKNAIVGNIGGLSLAKSKIIELSKKIDYLDKLLTQLNTAIDNFDPNRWVVENSLQDKVITITPLFAYDFAQDMMFRKADKVLLMSGSILNKESYCRNLGIDLNDCSFASLDSPFPVQNRKIFLLNSGSMSKKNMEGTLPKLIQDIKKILELHKQDKGIIHVSSHYMAKLISDKLKSKRIVIANDYNSRDEMLDYHYQTKENSVLLSPSMMQGLDLKGQLSRFQIIAKVPYPNLGSKYISTKKDLIKDWYAYQTAKTLVQAYGRSVRSEDDYAVTYVLDSDFMTFLKYNGSMLPKYFLQSISNGKL